MEDSAIIRLFFARNEEAIAETDRKYGTFCRRVALNILSVFEDAEECVNDTWHAAWQKIPPEKPESLQAFLGRIVRNISVSRLRSRLAKKRSTELEVLLSELDDCVPDRSGVESAVDRRYLADFISRWLDSLSENDRTLFIRRYWYCDAVRTLADEADCTAAQMAQRMLRLRRRLRSALEKEDIIL